MVVVVYVVKWFFSVAYVFLFNGSKLCKVGFTFKVFSFIIPIFDISKVTVSVVEVFNWWHVQHVCRTVEGLPASEPLWTSTQAAEDNWKAARSTQVGNLRDWTGDLNDSIGIYLARSANLPIGLYILPSVISLCIHRVVLLSVVAEWGRLYVNKNDGVNKWTEKKLK